MSPFLPSSRGTCNLGDSPTRVLEFKLSRFGPGQILYETNSHRPFVPASNTKAFTTALALDRLGGDYRIKTSWLARQPPGRNGVLAGDLVVYGRGDPSIHSGITNHAETGELGRLIDSLLDAGVRRVQGDLICNDFYFRGPPLGLGWAWDDLQEAYAPAVSALSLNDNVVRVVVHPGKTLGSPGHYEVEPVMPSDLQIGMKVTTSPATSRSSIQFERLPGQGAMLLSGTIPLGGELNSFEVSVPNPSRYFGERLRAELARRGIRVDGKLRFGSVAPMEGFREIASVHSASIAELVHAMMKPSNNLEAQLIWLQCGAVATEYPSDEEMGWPKTERTLDASKTFTRSIAKAV